MLYWGFLTFSLFLNQASLQNQNVGTAIIWHKVKRVSKILNIYLITHVLENGHNLNVFIFKSLNVDKEPMVAVNLMITVWSSCSRTAYQVKYKISIRSKVWNKTATADLRIHELYSTLPSNSNEKPVFTHKMIMLSKTENLHWH